MNLYNCVGGVFVDRERKHESVNGIERMKKREREREGEIDRRKKVSILLNVQCNYIVMYLA